MKLICSILMAALLFSCEKQKNTPEGVVDSFINYQFDHKENSREDYIELVTGELEDSFKKMSPDDFKIFEVTSTQDLHLVNVKYLKKYCEKDYCSLTYIIKYKQNDSKSNVDVKKRAKVVKVADTWKIESAGNLKTFIDLKEEIKIKVD